MNIISFDPGYSTGVAFTINGGIVTMVVNEIKEIYELLEASWDVVIIEQFISAGPLSKYALYTIGLIGIIQGYCYAKNIKCVLQLPQFRISKIQEAEEYLKLEKHVDHQVDSLAHLLKFESVNENS